jgi:hypothetical protein
VTNRPVVDVWDLKTFDEELRLVLNAHSDLFRDYLPRDREIFESYDLAPELDRPSLRPQNQFATDLHRLKENLISPMAERRIRAFHYTRLTDREVERLKCDGIHLSTPESLHSRLLGLDEIDAFTLEETEALEAESPLHSQMNGRRGKFWMASHPIAIEHGDVERLLKYWGGEVASFHLNNERLLARLARIGFPRVIEVAVPLAATKHTFAAVQAVVATFGRSFNCTVDQEGFDLYTETALSATAVLRVHSIGEANYELMGQTYPSNFISEIQ